MRGHLPLSLVMTVMTSILIAGCNDKKDNIVLPDYLSSAECERLDGTEILVGEELGMPGQLWCFGDTLVISDVTPEFLYAVCSVSGDSVISGCVRRGEGPGELIRAGYLQKSDRNGILLFDDMSRRLYSYDSLERFIHPVDTARSEIIEDATGGYLYETPQGYVGDVHYGDGHIMDFIGKNGKKISSFGQVPGTETGSDVQPDFYMAYQAQFCSSPDGHAICAAGMFHDWLAFFDVSSTPVKTREYFSSGPQVEASGSGENYHLRTLPSTVSHYWSMAPWRKGVYVLYIGATETEIESKGYYCKILSYDWDGNFKGAYSVGEKIGSIASSDNGKTIYAVSFPEAYPESKIFRYDLR